MIAAALTLWITFALWVAGPVLNLSRGVMRTAAGLLAAELVVLLAASYGCEFGCSPFGAAARVAGRTDFPVLTCVFAASLAVQRLRAVLS